MPAPKDNPSATSESVSQPRPAELEHDEEHDEDERVEAPNGSCTLEG
jgi:hypothetical protein